MRVEGFFWWWCEGEGFEGCVRTTLGGGLRERRRVGAAGGGGSRKRRGRNIRKIRDQEEREGFAMSFRF